MISSLAIVSGLTGALLFMIFGWPLANLLSLGRVIFDSFQMKILLAAIIGVAVAPLAERHAPILQEVVARLETERQNLPAYIDALSDRLP